MLKIITPCSRPNNLLTIARTIPSQAQWIICHDNKFGSLPIIDSATIMVCEDNGLVGTKARNYVLDNYEFDDGDNILFHDDDNIIHPDLYKKIEHLLNKDFSVLCWGQLYKNGSIRLRPTQQPRINKIDTASYLIKWKYNKNIRHDTTIYQHDGKYAEQCSQNGPVKVIKQYLSYYNYLAN